MANPHLPPNRWQPTRLLRVVESVTSSMGTTKVKTDATFAYLKAIGNREGTHQLACELVGSALAEWFCLTVPAFALLTLAPEDCFELPCGARTQPGPAFVSRQTNGRVWGGSETELRDLENADDITRLVVFDTWTRNRDRHPPDLTTWRPNCDNVYLADTDHPGRSRLVALDHGQCFAWGRDLNAQLTHIDRVQDEGTYGLFPQFRPFLDPGQLAWCEAMLRSLRRADVEGIVNSIPAEWGVPGVARAALVEQITRRALFVANRIDSGWPLDGGTDSPAVPIGTP